MNQCSFTHSWRRRPLFVAFSSRPSRYRSTEVDFNLVFIGPAIHRLADEIAAVVGLDRLCRFAIPGNPVNHFDNILAVQTLSNVNGQTVSREAVHHRVHAPHRVSVLCGCLRWLQTLMA